MGNVYVFREIEISDPVYKTGSEHSLQYDQKLVPDPNLFILSFFFLQT